MAVKITNPSIIDLAAWQEVISEVNSVANKVDNIVTGYGSANPNDPDWVGSQTRTHEFNIGSQRIVSGRYRFVATEETTDGKFISGKIPFDTAFANKPIITATIEFGNQTVPEMAASANVVLVLWDADSTGFRFRMTNAGSSTQLAGTFYINWMAIGPR